MSTEPTWKPLKDMDTDVQAESSANRLEFTLPSAWWNRPKPNAWAGLFVHSGGVELDTAAGFTSTFRFITQPEPASSSDPVNPRIVSLQSVVERLDHAGDESSEGSAGSNHAASIDSLRFIQADIAALPYEGSKFDIVFGLSVLHRLASEEAQLALDEFRRVLRSGGLLVLTFDDSFADFPSFARLVRASGYSFAGEFDSYVSHEARTNSARGRLYAFRAEDNCQSES